MAGRRSGKRKGSGQTEGPTVSASAATSSQRSSRINASRQARRGAELSSIAEEDVDLRVAKRRRVATEVDIRKEAQVEPEQHSQSRADDHAVGDYAATNPISLVDDNDGGGGDDDKVDYIYLANRIQHAIEQASQPRHPHALVSHNTFKLPITDSPSKPLTLLRNIPLATLLATTPIHEIYSLPIPIASPAFRAPSEQWWVGLSPAEMRAGPIRDETSVRDAEREVRNREKRRVKSLTAKNGMLKQQEEYAREGLKRQVLGLPMEGFVGLGAEREGRRKYGKEWERVLGELEGDVLEKDGEAEGEGELVEDEQGDNSDDGNYVER